MGGLPGQVTASSSLHLNGPDHEAGSGAERPLSYGRFTLTCGHDASFGSGMQNDEGPGLFLVRTKELKYFAVFGLADQFQVFFKFFRNNAVYILNRAAECVLCGQLGRQEYATNSCQGGSAFVHRNPTQNG